MIAPLAQTGATMNTKQEVLGAINDVAAKVETVADKTGTVGKIASNLLQLGMAGAVVFLFFLGMLGFYFLMKDERQAAESRFEKIMDRSLLEAREQRLDHQQSTSKLYEGLGSVKAAVNENKASVDASTRAIERVGLESVGAAKDAAKAAQSAADAAKEVAKKLETKPPD